MELSIATTYSDHDITFVKSELNKAGSKQVFVDLNHLNGHPDVVLLDQLSQSLIDSVTNLGLIVNAILEHGLSLCRNHIIVSIV